MELLDESVFHNLHTVKCLADNGFLEPFLKQCGGNMLDQDDFYDLAWEAITCIFPNVAGYWNQENEVDTVVIFDPLVDEFCRLLAQYEASCGVAPGESDLRRTAVNDVVYAFALDDYPDGFYIYDYDFRICDTGHGRKRLVLLSGIEFCGIREVPGALAEVYRTLECQVQRLRRELGIKQPAVTDAAEEREAA